MRCTAGYTLYGKQQNKNMLQMQSRAQVLDVSNIFVRSLGKENTHNVSQQYNNQNIYYFKYLNHYYYLLLL